MSKELIHFLFFFIFGLMGGFVFGLALLRIEMITDRLKKSLEATNRDTP